MTSATTAIEVVLEHVLEPRRQDAGAGREAALLVQVADERPDDAKPVPGRALDVVGVVLEKPVDGGADRAVAEKRYRDVNGRHCAVLARRRGGPSRPARSRSSSPTSLDLVLGGLPPELLEARPAGFLVREQLAGEGAAADVLEDLPERLAHVVVDHDRPAREVAVLGHVGDDVPHVREAALVDQVDDQLQLVDALVVGDLRLVAGVDERLVAGLHERRDAAAEHGLLAEEVGLGLLREGRLEQARRERSRSPTP